MAWLVFSYSLPSKGHSSPRVALWRRLQRVGAVSITGSVYLLPDRADSLEAFQWLSQEVESAGGEALVLRVEQMENMADASVVARFNAARSADYRELEQLVDAVLHRELGNASNDESFSTLEKLRKRYSELSRIDFFGAPEGEAVAAKLAQLGQTPSKTRLATPEIERVDPFAFKNRTWITRPKPHVDRLASIWLIRRFIDAAAAVRYGNVPEDNEVSFDMQNARFGHVGAFCTFETLKAAFGLSDPALDRLAEIVHEIDLRDGRYAAPETPGIDAVLEGWRRLPLTDAELEKHGVALFEGLYAFFAQRKPTGDP